MQQVTITDRAYELARAFRDEEYTDCIKAYLLDAVCGVIDDANENDAMSSNDLHLLAAISILNELITELSKTSDN